MTILIPAWRGDHLEPVEKLEVHRQGLRHKAVSVFVQRRGAVLLQRRAMSKYHTPGLWANTCCTHPSWGEDALDCAQRRLREELGITGLQPRPRGRVEYRADVGGGLVEHELVEVFLAEADDALVVRPNPAEVMEVAWMAFEDLNQAVAQTPDLYTPWLRIYLQDHAARIFDAL